MQSRLQIGNHGAKKRLYQIRFNLDNLRELYPKQSGVPCRSKQTHCAIWDTLFSAVHDGSNPSKVFYYGRSQVFSTADHMVTLLRFIQKQFALNRMKFPNFETKELYSINNVFSFPHLYFPLMGIALNKSKKNYLAHNNKHKIKKWTKTKLKF